MSNQAPGETPVRDKALAEVLRAIHTLHHSVNYLKYPNSYGDWWDNSKDDLLLIADILDPQVVPNE